MKLIAISGDGAGAGKTFAARTFGQHVWTLADGIRAELTRYYPRYNWYDRTQAYKDGVLVSEWAPGATVRTVLLQYGQQKCVNDPCYWVRALCDQLVPYSHLVGVHTLAIDDVRKLCELEYLRAKFPDVVHLHVANDAAAVEPEFEAEALRKCAAYVIHWA